MKPVELEVTHIRKAAPKRSWEETAREMAAAGEDWSEWDATTADGLDTTPWTPARVRS